MDLDTCSHSLALAVHLEARDRRKAMKLLQRLGDACQIDVSPFRVEPYSKVRDQYRGQALYDLGTMPLADAWLEIPMRLEPIGHSWFCGLPVIHAGGGWSFEGICSEPSMVGSAWAQFDVFPTSAFERVDGGSVDQAWHRVPIDGLVDSLA
jgi:hypothetical protein